MSLRTKLIWPIFVSMAFVFVANQAYTFHAINESIKNSLSAHVQSHINEHAQSITSALVSNDKQEVHRLFKPFLTQPNVSSVKLYNKGNHPIVSLAHESGESSDTFSETSTRIHQYIDKVTQQYWSIFEPIIYQEERLGTVHLTLSKDLVMHAIIDIGSKIPLFAILLITVSVTLYFCIERKIMRPIARLNRSLQDFSDGFDIKSKPEPKGSDELSRTLSLFNLTAGKRQNKEKHLQARLETLEQQSLFALDLFDTIPNALVITDNSGRIIRCNWLAQKLFDIDRNNLGEQNICHFIKLKPPIQMSLLLSRGLEYDDIHIESENTEQQLSLSSRRLTKQGYLLFTIQDITEVEEAINRQRVAGRVFEHSQDGLIVLNNKGIITMANPAVTKFIGEADQLVGRSFMKMIPWKRLEFIMPTIVESIDNYGMWQGEMIEKNHNGVLIPMFVKVNRIARSEDKHAYDLVIILTDLSNAKEMERLEYLTHHDELTGLANRTKFHLELDKLVTMSSYLRDEFAVLYLDLDGFKGINDSYGHDAGDEVLKQVASRMNDVSRYGDLSARLAGDEFVMIVKSINSEEVTRIAKRLLDVICQPISYRGASMAVGVSIGAKLVSIDERDPTAILKNADTAMYQAKKAGKGQIIVIGCESDQTV
ncbi:diguanylate cyclase [Vibrio alfacsensis]|uniref:diguanylate cyclase domain-containing protein n=1 Tax=Vibrio alfacsensis TaxID=1074311 RepID=UPI002ADDC98B|nr:diguanylate cyclase [Vibrio alfacsensis]WQE78257.1 diguanylate cyclase [Vibrio alfacsensis]